MPTTPPWAPPGAVPAAAPTILIVDDDAVVAGLLAAIVRGLGWQPVIAADAMQGTMFAVRGAPSAIVLDLVMPGGGGLGVLRKLRANVRTAGVPVVVPSGAIDPALPDAVRELGAVAFVPKPVDPAAMRALLQQVVGGA